MDDVTNKAHVLLVDDEPGVRDSIALLLELEGYRVTQAPDGQEAWELLGQARPDLVISDYMMPRLNGRQLAERLRSDPTLEDIPILLMSGALPPAVDPAAIADGFLQKPASFAHLNQMVELLLSRAAD
ncbi:response regulator [Ectothiorhodospiraceae bacterium 2226]|nr:response regulator [Ectothiorhodospiraceae bacterium 2226]